MMAVDVTEEKRPLRVSHAPIVLIHARIDVTIGIENVFPAVVVVVQEARAPPQEGDGYGGHPRQKADLREIPLAPVLVERKVTVRNRSEVERQVPALLRIPA